MTPALWIVLAACAVAAATDIRWRRIPNPLTGALIVAGLIVNGLLGWRFLLVSIAVFACVFAFGYFTFCMGWLKGGDVKLMSGVGAALGFPDTLSFLIYTSLAGGVLAVVMAALTGRLRSTYENVALILRPLAYKGTVAVEPKTKFMLPYAVAIGCGAGLVALSHTAAPFLRLPL